MTLSAIIFGSIGVLTETSELQRAAFNAAFAEAGLDWHWSASDYTRLVADGATGGHDRINSHAASKGLANVDVPTVHRRKSEIFQAMMEAGGIAPNAGVVDLIDEARAAGIAVAMASSTSANNIAAMFAATAPRLTVDMFDFVTCADTVTHGKPSPDVYLAVLERLGVAAEAAIAIEDTRQSAVSPAAAGILTVIVPGAIAQAQDFGRLPVWRSVAAIGGVATLRALLAETTASA